MPVSVQRVTARKAKVGRLMHSSAPSQPGIAPFGPQYEQWRRDRPDVSFTVGNFWPYATTLFDYVRRAMPPSAPGTLSSAEVYSLVAWLLAQNGIITEAEVMTAESLPKVVMPARSRFVPDDRRGGRQCGSVALVTRYK